MCRKLAVLLSISAVTSIVFAAEVRSGSGAPLAVAAPVEPATENADDFRIAITADAAKKNEHSEKLELYSKCHAGDAASRKKWENLKRSDRTAILADVACEPGESPVRSQAIKELATQSPSEDPEGTALVALAQCAVKEKDGALRALARNGLAARQDERTAKLLVPALGHDNVLIRDNAAAALKAVGGPRVFEVIIEHWKEFWGPGNRGYVFIGQQRSYVSDYDINGDSYDPVVRTFMTGVCLDVKSLKVEGDIWYKTIREIAPDDVKLPENPAAWQKWVDKDRMKLAVDADKKRDVARAALAGIEDE
jgi:hypothetical protein